MKRKREFIDYVDDIFDSINKIEKFIAAQTYEDFAIDDKTQFAVIRALEIIGEASKKVPDSVRQEFSTVPWRLMAGMRDKLIHVYFGVDTEVVWKTATIDIQDIKCSIQKLRSKYQG